MTFSSSNSRFLLCAVSFAVSLTSLSAFADTNLALNKPVIASSSENASLGPSNAFDGNSYTRWASAHTEKNWIYVDLGSQYNINKVKLNWEIAYAKGYEIQFSNDSNSWSTVYTTQNGDGGIDEVSVSGTARYVRMNGLKRSTEWGYSLWDFEVYGSAYTAPKPGKISQKKAVTASSYESASLAPKNVNDGSTSTRWASSVSDKNWIAIDLGSNYVITGAKIHWETAYASGYQIQVSRDGSNWTNIYSTTSGDGGVDNLQMSGEGRYVRMNGTKRATEWGYSIWEFEVFGYQSTESTNPPSSSSSSSTSSKSSSSVKSSSSSSVKSSSSSSVKSSSSSSSSTGAVGGGVTLDWYIPTERENGDYLELDEIRGYEIKYKKAGDSKFTFVLVNDGNVDRYSFGNLSGNYEFYIATIDTDGIYSDYVKIQPYQY